MIFMCLVLIIQRDSQAAATDFSELLATLCLHEGISSEPHSSMQFHGDQKTNDPFCVPPHPESHFVYVMQSQVLLQSLNGKWVLLYYAAVP